MLFYIFLCIGSSYLPRRICGNMSFCRDNIDHHTKFRILKETINFKNQIFSSNIFEEESKTYFQFELYHISNGGFRFRVEPTEEENFSRFDLSNEPLVINEKYITQKDFSIIKNFESSSIFSGFGSDTAEIFYDPFRIEIKSSNQLIVTINNNNFLNFNKFPKKLEPEIYDGFVDPNKNGLTSVLCDFEFPEFVYISGFGSRSSEMNLKDGIFRMYNHGGFSNYGTIPFFIAHSPTITASIFWMNPSDTFVDIQRSPKSKSQNDEQTFNKETNFKNKTRKIKFLSEGGYIDFIINIGKYDQLIESYTDLTGKPSMPPLFAFGYHQSHWGYKTQEKVENVIYNLDKYKIPYDVIWLDIDHLDSYSPFTVDEYNFPNLNQLIEKLKQKNRYLVRITDPHISVNQKLSEEGLLKDYFVMQTPSKKHPFEGICWPGESYWPDFLNKNVRNWWSTQFRTTRFPNNVFIWNDMNEPSVFQMIDGTFPKNLIHKDDHNIEYEEREVHNLYGLLNTAATNEGLTRYRLNERPFILSRSHFSGSQKFAWLWSGDNDAEWIDLESSLGHLINFGISGFPFVGADVGGFAGDPSDRLIQRWFQTASWCYPFFREHSHIESSPREPYLYGPIIHKSIINRYKLLPLFYTAARKANLTGIPIIQPLWAEFSDVPVLHRIQNQLLVAETLLVCPVTSKKIDHEKKMMIHIPPGFWYDIRNGKKLKKVINLNDDDIPVFVRGGKIFLTYSETGENVKNTLKKPLTLHVALDQNGKASGEVYFDDGFSFNFTNGEYFRKRFSFMKGILKMRTISRFKETIPEYVNDLKINKIKIYGIEFLKQKLNLDFDGQLKNFGKNLIIIDNVQLNLLGDFTLFDGVLDSGIKVRTVVFKIILGCLMISIFLPFIAHFCTNCHNRFKPKNSSEESLIKGNRYMQPLDPDYSDSFSF